MPEITLRPETDTDIDFLCELYASTRRDEVGQTGWSEDEIDAFLKMQFEAQRKHYLEHYADSAFDIIEQAGQAIGRLYLQENEGDLLIVDIALLPAARGQRIGGRLLRDIIDKAQLKALPVRIHVEANNPAMSLYKRLGFVKIEDKGVYHFMEYPAAKA